MKMFARLRYLMAEGFEVASISAYDGDTGDERGHASITWVEQRTNGQRRLRSEHFEVTEAEARACAKVMLHH